MDTRLKIGTVFMYIVASISLIFGIIYIFLKEPMPYHLQFISMTYEELIAQNANLAEILMIFIHVAGSLFICLGIITIGIIHNGYKRGERWVFFTLFPGLLGVALTILILTGDKKTVLTWIMSGYILSLFFGMLIPLNNFFGKKES